MCSVTVVMAAFNAREFIRDSIESVIAQTLRDWELIVIDDASTDGTAEYVSAQYGHLPNVKCLALASNGGPSAARNIGIEHASGRWLAILDSDDRFAPTRLEHLVTIGERHALDAIADNQLYFDDATQRVFQAALKLPADHIEISLPTLLQNDGPPLRFSFGALKLLMRREFLLTHAVRYQEDLRLAEDFALLYELLASGAKAWLVAEHLYVYTVPRARSQAASEKTRTNYGKGNIESLIELNDRLASEAQKNSTLAHLTPLFRQRHRRFACALVLRDLRELPPLSAVRRVLTQRGWLRFAADKARNAFQRYHSVRGHHALPRDALTF